MTDILNAAADARRLLAGFKAIDTVASTLENIGSIVQAGEEAAKRLESLQTSCAKAQAALKDARSTAVSIVAEAEVNADEIRAAAETFAADRVKQADDRAAEVMADAQRFVDAKAEELREKDVELHAQVVAANNLREAMLALEARANDARAYLNALKS